jgi:hypothetical protein
MNQEGKIKTYAGEKKKERKERLKGNGGEPKHNGEHRD